MRRKDREITDFAAMLAIVRDCDCCRLGISAEGAPYILPLNFGYEVNGETLTLYFHGARQGEKHALLRENSQVSFEMDTGHRLLPGDQAGDGQQNPDAVCQQQKENQIEKGAQPVVAQSF